MAVAILSVWITPNRVAAEDSEYARNGLYVSAAGSWAIYPDLADAANQAFTTTVPVDVQSPLGFDTRFGYRFHPRFATEAQFEWLSEAEIPLTATSQFQLETWTLTANAKAYILTGRYQPFILLGVGTTNFEYGDEAAVGINVEGYNFAARMGGGIDLYATRNIVVSLDATYVINAIVDQQRLRSTPEEYLGLVTDGPNHFSLTWGLQYRF